MHRHPSRKHAEFFEVFLCSRSGDGVQNKGQGLDLAVVIARRLEILVSC